MQLVSADLDLILQKSPFLIQEMVSCVAQLIAMAKAGRSKTPYILFYFILFYFHFMQFCTLILRQYSSFDAKCTMIPSGHYVCLMK